MQYSARNTQHALLHTWLPATDLPTLLWRAGALALWALLPWAVSSSAWRLMLTLTQADDGPTLSAALAATAELDLLFSLPFAVGLVT
jgi:1,4-dihydroxy-2-naphthoate octaprenyltransferase